MTLTEKLRFDASQIWEKILKHPFVLELYNGTLPLNKFKYYIVQDYNYLISMMKCFSLIASKADIELAKKALEIAHTDATTEMENYKRILGKLGLELRQVVESEPSPTNEAYMNFLIKTCALGTPLESLVAVLPCFWTYLEIAKYHKESLKNNPVKIYVEWAQPYLSKEYEALVTELIDLINSRSGNQEYAILKNLFIKGSRYEWMFWDMAYRMEKWPI